jgi:hypothetical protein
MAVRVVSLTVQYQGLAGDKMINVTGDVSKPLTVICFSTNTFSMDIVFNRPYTVPNPCMSQVYIHCIHTFDLYIDGSMCVENIYFPIRRRHATMTYINTPSSHVSYMIRTVYHYICVSGCPSLPVGGYRSRTVPDRRSIRFAITRIQS